MKQFFCYEEPDNAQKKCDLEILARPFWMGNIMYNEKGEPIYEYDQKYVLKLEVVSTQFKSTK